MANERIFMINTRTGRGVMVGKSLGVGWYLKDDSEASLGKRINALYDESEITDSFMLLYESDPNCELIEAPGSSGILSFVPPPTGEAE
jgi:hypothetical protein